ncbi:VCBS repeat-containing protein [uncultured Algibacter sp.]|uniref:VCBS repeat-containing protein n=1 Tax=uncultured Algibacter sp. TaxID=298659 RepID=UPI0026056CDC|nr:VCBS repeat-containing protein [uncultured Algibacter sp.]
MPNVKHNILQVLYKYPFLVILLFCFNCNETDNSKTVIKTNTLFTLIDSQHSHVNFSNQIEENLYFNFINYAYIYNGGGVAVGDINNDGLEDLYFSSNQQSNKLYLNKGKFIFEDITNQAKVTDDTGWTTGVSMVDINNDGWVDIYVCKSGSLKNHELRKNKLYINQKNNTFKEEASKYGLDHFGFSVQAYFFDYDNDSDLDMYLVNHRADFQNNTVINPQIQAQKEPYYSDQLFQNNGNSFSNVTKEAGLENKAWGLSASIGDFNSDNLPDIYVANDFLEPDFLYINQGNGTFKDDILSRLKHISANSMGSDYADINNDLNPDLIVLDMMAEDHIRSKENMATMSSENFNLIVKSGYHHQYMSNMLQLNNGNGTYSEIGQIAGIAKTDWSWAPLIADFDNDGYNDLFVTNGIENDLSNQDFRQNMRTNIQNRKKVSLDEAINMMPSAKLSNYMFQNNQALKFKNQTELWGLDEKVNSSGAVYADLDNDGDLDLVTNNQNSKASLYRNNTKKNYIRLSLNGPSKNTTGIGTKVIVYAQNSQQGKELYTNRGFQSSVTKTVHFGLSNYGQVDSLCVTWPDQRVQTLTNIKANQTIQLDYKNSLKKGRHKPQITPLFKDISPSELGIHYKQKENLFDDFSLQVLLPQKQSEKSNQLAVADVNNDGLADLYLGNSAGSSGYMYVQTMAGTFTRTNTDLFKSDKQFEDMHTLFVDVDNDDDMDLYIASGGYEIPNKSALLQDRLYINDGSGNFKKGQLPQLLMSTQKVIFADIDKDKDLDALLIGGVIHGKYPLAYSSKLLVNKSGTLKELVNSPNEFPKSHLINDAIFSDYDLDGDQDLIMVGEWMGILFFDNTNGTFKRKDIPELNNFSGWYQTIKEVDFDKDGHPDYLVGNWGENNKFKPSAEKPLHIYADYFDGNSSFDIALSKVSKHGNLLPVRGKECSAQQTPFINKKLKTYKAFAASTLPEIYGLEKLNKAFHFQASNFSSVLLKNNSDGSFEIKRLPVQAQFSPTLSFEVFDFNEDGYLDVWGVGNVYEAEVETIRYDASKGYILLGNNDGSFDYLNDLSYLNSNEARLIKKIDINNQTHFIIHNKNSEIKLLKFNR